MRTSSPSHFSHLVNFSSRLIRVCFTIIHLVPELEHRLYLSTISFINEIDPFIAKEECIESKYEPCEYHNTCATCSIQVLCCYICLLSLIITVSLSLIRVNNTTQVLHERWLGRRVRRRGLL